MDTVNAVEWNAGQVRDTARMLNRMGDTELLARIIAGATVDGKKWDAFYGALDVRVPYDPSVEYHQYTRVYIALALTDEYALDALWGEYEELPAG